MNFFGGDLCDLIPSKFINFILAVWYHLLFLILSFIVPFLNPVAI